MMHALLPYLLTLAILFFATLARSTLGFGDALVAMPLLTITLGIQEAAPLVALVSTFIGGIILLRQWHSVDFAATWHLLLAAACGIPLGLLILKEVPEPLTKVLLGAVIIVFSLYNLAKPQIVLHTDRFGLVYIFGFCAGILGGAYNTVGPLVVMYGNLRRWSPQQFRATLQSIFFPAYALIVVGHGVAGLLTLQVLGLCGLSLPLVAVAIVLGDKLNAAIPRESFTRYVNMALLLVGLVLCLRA